MSEAQPATKRGVDAIKAGTKYIARGIGKLRTSAQRSCLRSVDSLPVSPTSPVATGLGAPTKASRLPTPTPRRRSRIPRPKSSPCFERSAGRARSRAGRRSGYSLAPPSFCGRSRKFPLPCRWPGQPLRDQLRCGRVSARYFAAWSRASNPLRASPFRAREAWQRDPGVSPRRPASLQS